MSDDELDRIWRRRILPGTETMAVPCAEPVTVFLGGQPAAGKTRAQRRVVDLYGGGMMPIVGDDFRQYHPDYVRLVRDDPVGMPDTTARAAGHWTGMAVAYADAHDVSCIIEGTWRNRDTVLSEAPVDRPRAEQPRGRAGRAAGAEPSGAAAPLLHGPVRGQEGEMDAADRA